MSGDELTIAIYERQGFVVVSTDRPFEIGEVFHEQNSMHENTVMPLKVTGPATKDEFLKQLLLGDEILGLRRGSLGLYDWETHFYRVEAAD